MLVAALYHRGLLKVTGLVFFWPPQLFFLCCVFFFATTFFYLPQFFLLVFGMFCNSSLKSPPSKRLLFSFTAKWNSGGSSSGSHSTFSTPQLIRQTLDYSTSVLAVSPSRHRFMLLFWSDPPPNSDSPPLVAKAWWATMATFGFISHLVPRLLSIFIYVLQSFRFANISLSNWLMTF